MDEINSWVGRASYVEVAGEDVAVFDVTDSDASADRPPLLVLHGFPTSSIDFRPVLGALSARRRVVLVDFPGYGLSAKPDRSYSLFSQADVVEAVVGRLGLTEVDLLTHDMGDSVGAELLARALDGDLGFRVRRRVLTNGSIYLELAQLTDGQKLLRGLPDELLPVEMTLDEAGLTDALVALCAPGLQEDVAVRGRLAAGAGLVQRDGGGRLLPRLIRYLDERAVHEPRWAHALETHPAELTVVWGRHDPIAVAAMADRLVNRRPDATLVWLDAGHWPMLEAPDAFAAAVLDAF